MPDDEKVSITSKYIFGDTKLWWRTQMGDDAKSGRPKITTGETKKETKRTIYGFKFNLACKRVLEATEANRFGKGIC